MSSRRAEIRLGLTMLAYMVVVISLITLAPFRFHRPETWTFVTEGDGFDVVMNAFLFSIPGFLLRLTTGRRRDAYCILPLLFGLVFSALLEGGQLFLEGRFTSPVDVAANAFGCWCGAQLHDGLARLLERRLPGVLALELPLMGIVYLIVPLLWLHGYASEGSADREMLALLPGLVGGLLLASVWHHRLRAAGVLGPVRVALIAGGWFMVCSLTGVRDHGQQLLLASAGLSVLVWLTLVAPAFLAVPGRRFERTSILRVAPIYLAYVVFLSLWPWSGGLAMSGLEVSVHYVDFDTLPGQVQMLRELEYLAAATLGGYLLAESVGRHESRASLALVAATIVVIAAAIELLRGFHPEYAASLLRFAFAAVSTVFGAAIYGRQLDAVRKLVGEIAAD